MVIVVVGVVVIVVVIVGGGEPHARVERESAGKIRGCMGSNADGEGRCCDRCKHV